MIICCIVFIRTFFSFCSQEFCPPFSMWEAKQFEIMSYHISLHFVKMHTNFHLSYSILVRKSKNVMIPLQKFQENPLKISFSFQNGDKIFIYVSTHGHWNCTTLQHHCTIFGFASSYAELLQVGTIVMSTGRHVDNW